MMRIPRHLRSFFIPANVPQFETTDRDIQLLPVSTTARLRHQLQNPHRVDFFFLWFGLLVYSQEIISSARPPTSDSRSPDLQHDSLSIPSCHVSSLWGTDGHCDCLGWFQQHLPMGANEQVSPEFDTVTQHRAHKHAGTNDQAGLSYRDEALNEMRQDLVLV